MAAKDADLARDVAHHHLYISNSKVARFEVELTATPPGNREETLFLAGAVGGGTGGAGVTYRMRGYDTNVSVDSIVYWDSTGVDTNAEDYAGSAGPVINVIISDIVGD